ncbi:exodeoxyribonuclease III [Flexivirga caeni]|uniref:Exodeoxyribonuclease III n=1 Tax=Flexivirga caeni TaxID=2294115 RepID=A0A3M9MC96_9MICO|nr:exodeoxyribonuclease III [Flexivirga caeni]RNI22208.1 exodeoxyribonuclease III [Flexivirga caeni]
MRVVTANVNGIRAAVRRGGLAWLAGQDADALALQEVRASSEQLRAALTGTDFESWHVIHAPSGDAGRAGVAVLSPHPVLDSLVGLPGFEETGRWVEATVQVAGSPVTVVSAYVHTGEAGTPKQDEKFAFLEAMGERMASLIARDAVVTGDFNICHTARDLKNWKGNRGKAGFLPEEQKHLSQWFESGWVDVVREQAGDVDGPYTWWSWRGKAFDNDAGWRIDYVLDSPSLAGRVERHLIGRAAAYSERWSDHAAVVVDHR